MSEFEEDEVVFDAPHLFYDIGADAQLEYDDGTDRFFDVFHPEHEPPGPKPPPQRLLPRDEGEDSGADAHALQPESACDWDAISPGVAQRSTPRMSPALARSSPAPPWAGLNADDPSAGSPRDEEAPARRKPSSGSRVVDGVETGPTGTAVRRRAPLHELPELGPNSNADRRALAPRASAKGGNAADPHESSPAAAGKRGRRGSIADADLRRLLMEHNMKVRRQASGRAPAQPAAAKGEGRGAEARGAAEPREALGAARGAHAGPAQPGTGADSPSKAPLPAALLAAPALPASHEPPPLLSGSAAAAALRTGEPAEAAPPAPRARLGTSGATAASLVAKRRVAEAAAEASLALAAKAADLAEARESEQGLREMREVLSLHNARVLRERVHKRELALSKGEQQQQQQPQPAGASAGPAQPSARAAQPPPASAPAASAGPSADGAPSAGAQPRKPPPAEAAGRQDAESRKRPGSAVAGGRAQPPSRAQPPAKARPERPEFQGAGRAAMPPAGRPVGSASARTEILGDDELVRLLRAHNSKFTPKPAYEPRQHSVKAVKEWEAAHSRRYHELSFEDRAEANRQISVMQSEKEVDPLLMS